MSEIFSWGKACGRYQCVFWKLGSWSSLRDFFGGYLQNLKHIKSSVSSHIFSHILHTVVVLI